MPHALPILADKRREERGFAAGKVVAVQLNGFLPAAEHHHAEVVVRYAHIIARVVLFNLLEELLRSSCLEASGLRLLYRAFARSDHFGLGELLLPPRIRTFEHL